MRGLARRIHSRWLVLMSSMWTVVSFSADWLTSSTSPTLHMPSVRFHTSTTLPRFNTRANSLSRSTAATGAAAAARARSDRSTHSSSSSSSSTTVADGLRAVVQEAGAEWAEADEEEEEEGWRVKGREESVGWVLWLAGMLECSGGEGVNERVDEAIAAVTVPKEGETNAPEVGGSDCTVSDVDGAGAGRAGCIRSPGDRLVPSTRARLAGGQSNE